MRGSPDGSREGRSISVKLKFLAYSSSYSIIGKAKWYNTNLTIVLKNGQFRSIT